MVSERVEFIASAVVVTVIGVGASAASAVLAPPVFELDSASLYAQWGLLVFIAVGCFYTALLIWWTRIRFVPAYKRAEKERWRQMKWEAKQGLRYPVTRAGRLWAHVYYVPMYKRQEKAAARAAKQAARRS